MTGVNMFEKEAEDYVMREDVITENDRVPFDNGYGFQTVSFEDEVKKAFKDGAEFGYNKANEWHYVKDGDLPKETGLLMSKTLLLVTKMKGSDCLSLTLGQYNFSTQEFRYQHIVGLTDVIAWKEIVLPEEIKE